MLGISLICVGKLKERFYADAQAEFIKRLGGYCRLTVTELPESTLAEGASQAQAAAALLREAELIEARIPRGAAVIALCIEGEQADSVQFARMLEKYAVEGDSRLAFIIGGSNGLDGRIKTAARRVSLSRMTFPHHLARVMLLEQIYRGFKILEGGKYHK